MKVKDVGVKQSEFHAVPNIEGKTKTVQNTVSFKKHMSDISKSNCAEILTSLADEINKQGNIICKKCDIKEFKKYKEIISKFLQEAVKFGFEFDKQSKFDSSGRFRIYANIKKVNRKIESLTQEFLKEQKDPIQILELVDDIRGLILNIIL